MRRRCDEAAIGAFIMETHPLIIVLGGANGAGKSTAAATVLPQEIPFLNADEIAKTLPDYPSMAADLEASRIILTLMDEREENRDSFAVETTLASRSLAARVIRLKKVGYQFRLVYIWSASADFSVERVSSRVRLGGHDIPEDTIRRRYAAGLKNFFHLYLPLADFWEVHDNTSKEAQDSLWKDAPVSPRQFLIRKSGSA